MKTLYQCEYCETIYDTEQECWKCEKSHLNNIDALKYEIIHNGETVCDYCDHAYYVYGCERECAFEDRCNHKNNYAGFLPTIPLHDKRKNGGV